MIQHVITILVTTIVIAAGKIVWDGATTWKDKVKDTETNLNTLVENLAGRLAAYETSQLALSNQIAGLQLTLQKFVLEVETPSWSETNTPSTQTDPSQSTTDPAIAIPGEQIPPIHFPVTQEDLYQARQQMQQQAIKGDLEKSFKK